MLQANVTLNYFHNAFLVDEKRREKEKSEEQFQGHTMIGVMTTNQGKKFLSF